jgi:SOS-response transcriptional repressor LexA
VERSERIFAYVADYIAQHGYAPTYREIASGCAIPSLNSVRGHLARLDQAGRLKWTPGVSRGIALVEENRPDA